MENLPLPRRIVGLLGYPRVAHLPHRQQAALSHFWLDGLFASLSVALVDTYYALYMVALGASNTQVGLVNSLLQLASAVAAVPGALIAERHGHYKRVVLIYMGVIGRLMWLVMLIAPWLLANEQAVWLILIAWVGIGGFNAFGNAAWTALSADLVPQDMRGRYFASRNIVMALVRLAGVPVAGQIVNRFGAPAGYQINLALAMLLGAGAFYFYSRLPEHEPQTSAAEPAPRAERTAGPRVRLSLPRNFVAFMVAHAVLSLGVGFAGPFFVVYQSEVLGFDAGLIGLLAALNGIAGLGATRLLGRLQDQRGNLWVMRFGVGVALIPLVWIGVSTPLQALFAQVWGTLAWTGYNLGAFNLLLLNTPDEHRPRYVALHSTFAALGAMIGPAIGGWLLDVIGWTPVFGLSAIIRAGGLILLFALVREPGKQGSTY